MTLPELVNLAGTISVYTWMFGLFLGAIGATLATLTFLLLLFRKERRFLKNVERPIMIFYPKNSPLDMKLETNLLDDSGFFEIPENPTNDYRNCHRIKDHSLVIVGYEPGMEGFKDILNAVENAKIPVIIYTKKPLAEEDKALLNKYPYHSVCNFPLKLMNDTFTILSTFPEKK